MSTAIHSIAATVFTSCWRQIPVMTRHQTMLNISVLFLLSTFETHIFSTVSLYAETVRLSQCECALSLCVQVIPKQFKVN